LLLVLLRTSSKSFQVIRPIDIFPSPTCPALLPLAPPYAAHPIPTRLHLIPKPAHLLRHSSREITTQKAKEKKKKEENYEKNCWFLIAGMSAKNYRRKKEK
jgi:hypothetical protein